MPTEQALLLRSERTCELCGAREGLEVHEVPPSSLGAPEKCALLCSTCRAQIEDPEKTDEQHWRCLNDSMWSSIPAVQVLAWRMLTRLRSKGWPQELLDMLYLDEATLAWAQIEDEETNQEGAVRHLDSNGANLAAGDNVTLIKDLTVKGANFTAKRGTVVRGISLVADNSEQIEARVSGQQIVILTKFVKKAN